MKELELETNYEVQIILEPNEKMFASDVYAIMIRNLIKNANEKSTCTIFDKDGIKRFTDDLDSSQLEDDVRFIFFNKPSKIFGTDVLCFFTSDLLEDEEGLFINLETLWDDLEYNHITGKIRFYELHDYINYQ